MYIKNSTVPCRLGLIGVAIGYFLRLIISLGKKGSIELEIKRMMLEAEEKAKKTVIEAETKSVEIMKETKEETRQKEEKFKATEDRLIKKEGLLDQRQTDIDKEVENIKQKVAEINKIKEKADKLEAHKNAELQAISHLTEEEAKNSLLSFDGEKIRGRFHGQNEKTRGNRGRQAEKCCERNFDHVDPAAFHFCRGGCHVHHSFHSFR